MPRGQGSLFSFQRSNRQNPKTEFRPADRPTVDHVRSQPLSKAERMLGEVGINRPATTQTQSHGGFSAPEDTLRKLQSKPSLINVKLTDTSPQLDWDYAQVRTYDVVEDSASARTAPPSLLNLPTRENPHYLAVGASRREDTLSLKSAGSSIKYQQANDSPMHPYFDLSSARLPLSPQVSPASHQQLGQEQVYTPISEFFMQHRPSIPDSEMTPPISPGTVLEDPSHPKNAATRKRPARLDLTKLFPKPRSALAGHYFSPDNSVRSPTRNSARLDQFPYPRPSSRGATRHPTGLNSHPVIESPQDPPSRALTPSTIKSNKTDRAPVVAPASDVRQRNFQSNIFENAKVHVRRPPKGIKNWFDGYLESDSSGEEEEVEEEFSPVAANYPPPSPAERPHSTAGNLSRRTTTSSIISGYQRSSMRKSQPLLSPTRAPLSPLPCLSPLIYVDNSTRAIDAESSRSTRSRASRVSEMRTRSMLSVSEGSESAHSPRASPRLPLVRDSIAVEDTGEDIIIAQAQAFEVQPRTSSARNTYHGPRTPTSMNMPVHSPVVRDFGAANDTASLDHLSVPHNPLVTLSPGKFRPQRSGHTRQPSIIPEDGVRSQTASPTLTDMDRSDDTAGIDTRSTTSQESHPLRVDSLSHKMMMVTDEEEALLEMMRRKRAAMAKQSFTDGYKTALHLSEHQGPQQSLESLRVVQALEQGSMQFSGSDQDLDSFPMPGGSSFQRRPSIQSNTSATTSLKSSGSLSHRTKVDQAQNVPVSPARYKSTIDNALGISTHTSPTIPQFLPQPERLERLTFSSFDMISRITNEPTSPVSRHTASSSPLPSPVTPRCGSEDVVVKVAASEPSTTGSVTESAPGDANTAMTESDQSKVEARQSTVSRRRRTASSETDIIMGLEERSPSVGTTPTMNRTPISNRSSIANARSIDALHEAIRASTENGELEAHLRELRLESDRTRMQEKTARRLSQSTNVSGNSSRTEVNSISDDVLSAWGSLGGWRDVEQMKAARA